MHEYPALVALLPVRAFARRIPPEPLPTESDSARVRTPDHWDRSEWLLAVVWLAALIVALPEVPRHARIDPSVLSVASEAGYSTIAAYRLALFWSVALAGLAWVLRRRAVPLPFAATDSPHSSGTMRPDRGRVVELIAFGLFALVAFWPDFLSVNAPYVEDGNFLSALHRMHGGMQPYRDFEYLYGPLMLAPAALWTRIAGFSALHYYAYLAALEMTVAVLVVWLSQRFVPHRRERLLAIIVVLALLANPLLGLNYNGLRRLLPIVGLLLLSYGFEDWRPRLAAAAVVGLALAYAHEQGLAALAAAGAIFAVELRVLRWDIWRRVIQRGLTFLAVAVVVWLLVSVAVTGSAFADYLREVRDLVARFSAGEAGFPFAWTLNAVAAFALLALGLVAVGRGLARPIATLEPGDRFVLATVVIAVVALKSGLTRADMFHLDAGFLGLSMAFVWPLFAPAFGPPPVVRRIGRAITIVLAATYVVGMLPTAAFVARGWVDGARARLGRIPTLHPPFRPAAPAVMLEHVEQDSATVALAAWMADAPHRSHPVLFYDRLWNVGTIIGVYKRDYLNDKFIYADERGAREREFLVRHPDALVVIERPSYERLWGIRPDTLFDPSEHGQPDSYFKRLASRLSSVHFTDVPLETRIHDVRWRRTVGEYVRAHFDPVASIGPVLVLGRRDFSVNGDRATSPALIR